MTSAQLFEQIQRKQSYLCVGLDTDLAKLPAHLRTAPDPVFRFNKAIIDATHHLAVAYKPNIAFYECLGPKGWESLARTVEYVREKYPELFLIADAKRGDIGNTSKMYAQAFFENMDFDAVTVAPYMGADSVKPFLEYPGKWVILLALTSNQGAFDFQFEANAQGTRLFERVLEVSQTWANSDQMMYVVGATKAESLTEVRTRVPQHFLLVPGVGAQGGSLADVTRFGRNAQCGLLVNASRSILYASSGTDFAQKAQAEAAALQSEMAALLQS